MCRSMVRRVLIYYAKVTIYCRLFTRDEIISLVVGARMVRAWGVLYGAWRKKHFSK